MSLHPLLASIALLACLAWPASQAVAQTSAPAPARADASGQTEDAFTPVIVTPIGTRHVTMPGTDGRYHAVYELELTNTKLAPASLQRIDVIDADAPSRVLATYAGQALLGSLRTLQPAPADDAVIPANASRLFYIELAFDDAGAVPQVLEHHLTLLGAANPGPHTPPTPLSYTAARVELSRTPLPVLQPPLRGAGWVAVNGCCNSAIVHRGSLQSVNGALYDSQRFAIDWMRLDEQGELVHGDPGVATHYVDYGAKVYAVADGTVVETLDGLEDQVPGKLPDPTTITLRTVDGNHVILAIGNGLYAFYAHLRKGSIAVRDGQRIQAGTVIAELGNTGNTSGPHLHFHVMDGTSALGSRGVPYVIDAFQRIGQIDIKAFDESDVLTGHWGTRLAEPIDEKARFPLNLNIVDFPAE